VLFPKTEKSAEMCHVACTGALQILLDVPCSGSLTSRQLLTDCWCYCFVTPYAVAVCRNMLISQTAGVYFYGV
jgi:hypothetical protein